MKTVMRNDWCPYCGCKLLPKNGTKKTHQKRLFTLDHIHPKSHGGPNTWYNYAGVCAECNTKKSSLSLLEFMMARATYKGKTRRERRRLAAHIRPKMLVGLGRMGDLPDRWFDPLATMGFVRTGQQQ